MLGHIVRLVVGLAVVLAALWCDIAVYSTGAPVAFSHTTPLLRNPAFILEPLALFIILPPIVSLCRGLSAIPLAKAMILCFAAATVLEAIYFLAFYFDTIVLAEVIFWASAILTICIFNLRRAARAE